MMYAYNDDKHTSLMMYAYNDVKRHSVISLLPQIYTLFYRTQGGKISPIFHLKMSQDP